jgi:hypothetical protein
MSNPYVSPSSRNPVDSTNERWMTRPRLFALGLVAMIALNASRLWITWRAFQTDGMEQTGFPFVFFERGGFSYHENWYLEMLAIDVVIAIAFACGMSHILRDGWGAAFRRLQAFCLGHVYTNVDNEIATEQSDARKSPVGREFES